MALLYPLSMRRKGSGGGKRVAGWNISANLASRSAARIEEPRTGGAGAGGSSPPELFCLWCGGGGGGCASEACRAGGGGGGGDTPGGRSTRGARSVPKCEAGFLVPTGGRAGAGGRCAGRPPGDGGDGGDTGGDLGTLMLCVREAILPFTINFLGGGEGRSGAGPGGFGARLGFPWLRGRSDRSDVESDDAGDGTRGVGADDSDVMLPPRADCEAACSELLFLCRVTPTLV